MRDSFLNCTSPWEIYDYRIQKKGRIPPSWKSSSINGDTIGARQTAITVDEVFSAVMAQLDISAVIAH